MSLRDALRIPASDVTDEVVYDDRRRLLAAFAASPTLLLAGCSDAAPPPPAGTNEELTRYADVTSYNNFYEFGSGKADPSHARRRCAPRPGRAVGGECASPAACRSTICSRALTPEERIYRLRCVEGWSMVIPWLGVPLARCSSASNRPRRRSTSPSPPSAIRQQMPGSRYAVLDWPYVEGLRIDEAMHPLTFLATGLYGKSCRNQNGAPLRLVVPWKYGFKGIKSIVRIEFVEQQPQTAWNAAQPDEYGFYSNVNPAVDHPRWSQETERRIAGGEQLFAERIRPSRSTATATRSRRCTRAWT